MNEHEIKIGTTYKCAQGWVRQPIAIEDTAHGGYREVVYKLGRLPEMLNSVGRGPLPWFAQNVIREING
jgi:hypothetical protein